MVPHLQTMDNGLPTPPTEHNSTVQHQLPDIPNGINCLFCRHYHQVGSCPLKLAGVEYCNLCGIAHYGMGRVCPHIQSETQVRSVMPLPPNFPPRGTDSMVNLLQVRAMIEALKNSTEPEHLVKAAARYLKGLKGSLVQTKKQKEAKELAALEAAKVMQFQNTQAPIGL